MNKRMICGLLTALLVLSIAGCNNAEPSEAAYSVVPKNYPDSVVDNQIIRQTENTTKVNNNNASSDRISFSATSISKFREALSSTFEDSDRFVYLGNNKNYDSFRNTASGIDLDISVSDSNEAAQKAFESYYSEYIDMVDSQGWEGSSKYSYDGNEGYVFVNGVSYRTRYYYDGIYLKDNVVVKVHLNADATSRRNQIDSFLRYLGYPAPSDYLN